MDEPILLSRGNLVVVAKNPPGKPFHEGGDAFILDPNHADGVLCQSHQQNYSQQSTKLQPTINERNKQQRFNWSKQFLIFWEGAKLVALKTQLFLLHLDEKWFYSLVVRSHNKWVPFFGVSPNYHNQHTKNSAEKILCIACAGFLPKDNEPRNGGESVLIDITRAGRMEIARRDTYRRVYHENGTYTMPVIPENRLRVRGQPYFVNLEITGSATKKAGKPKFPLLKHFRDTLIPKLDHAVAELSTKMNYAAWEDANDETIDD
jgi:hypothetical protein